jgi:hypothetical protein
MKLERLLQAFAGQPYFDYPAVRLNFQDESDHTSRTALSRFAKRGILLELKRGLYAFSAVGQMNQPLTCDMPSLIRAFLSLPSAAMAAQGRHSRS